MLVAAALAVLAPAPAAVVAQQPPAPAVAPSAAKPSEGASASRPQVIIEGQRSLEPRISAFVNQISGSYYAQALARWVRDVCPLVSGLSKQQGEFILTRISEIARAAGVPLAGEKCRANLYIMVAYDPRVLLQAMDDRNREFTFGDAPPDLIEQFITTTKPVRVWYHTNEKTPEGLPLLAMSFPAIEKPGQAGSPYPADQNFTTRTATGNSPAAVSFAPETRVDTTTSGKVGGGTNSWSQATRLSFNAIRDIYRVFVIVDSTQLDGISLGQVADYIAMVALAEIKTGVRPADSPTILNMFDAPQVAPPRLSDWDRAYLKSLYTTDQKSKLQRTLITREMVREIIPETAP